MSNAQTPGRGLPVGEDPDRDTWSSSLMGRTDELRHVQAQSEPVHAPPPVAPASSGPVRAPVASSSPAPVPPPPPRPLAVALKLGSAVCGLVAAVALVLPELQRFRETPSKDAVPRVETTLAPSFDAPAKVGEGEVGEQRVAIEGGILLMVDAVPTGVAVSVDGVKQGTTPVSLTLDCTPGAPLRVQFSRKGFDSLEHATVCQADTMTQLSARLRKTRSGGKP